MSEGLFDWVSEMSAPTEERLYGVMVATVKEGLDLTGLARVKVSIPALPEVEPWARIAAPFAGSDNGFFAIPQEGDEVLVAFERGDPRQAYVVGALWSSTSRPPAEFWDAENKRVLKTPKGHTVEFDDLQQTITITSSTKQEVSITTDEIAVTAGKGTAKITLGTDGSLKIEAVSEISLSAPRITLDAKAQLKLNGQSVSLQATGNCAIQGNPVAIN